MNKKSFKDLIVYNKSFDLAMEIYHISKKFPRDEIYSLTSQIRRSSRSVCSNLAESYRKRQYPAHFVSKISDADMENSETQVWIDFAYGCSFITQDMKDNLVRQSEEVGKLLYHMIKNPDNYFSKG